MYKVCSTEKTVASASEMETKALLHLLCNDGEEGEINGFAIDFFNDVTGMDSNAFRLYDIQSKGVDSGAKALGEELVTLFKNYTSEFKDSFVKQILFVRKVTKPVLGDPELSEFHFSDMTESAQQYLRNSLLDECKKKTYIDMTDVTEGDIDAFLNEVLFVVAKPDREDYIRPLIKTNSALGTTDKDLRKIFSEIRKLQVGIKSNSKVEGVEVAYPSDVYKFNRVIRRSDIELLIISRLLKQNPLG